jgi:dsRNA-specific ribonuclease
MFVGALFMEKGMEVVRAWLTELYKPVVEAIPKGSARLTKEMADELLRM